MKTLRNSGAAALASLAMAATLSAPAAAATLPPSLALIGNFTEVEVTADLAALGLTAAPFGSATASGAVFTFPVTGGVVFTDTSEALVEHDGSGVALTAGVTSAFVGNFFIDTEAGTVSGDGAVLGGAGFLGTTLFNFGTGDALPGIELLFSSDLAGVLSAVFGAPDLTGATFGYARPDLQVIPIPAAGLLLISALGTLVVARRRRQAV
ncbi:MAG: VPLPA-CTERM sorting domain-containing protein [Chromatiales bacterium]|nr:VPLPA-CTERM sorting domain-containing protein [Chromatiales bacterium]